MNRTGMSAKCRVRKLITVLGIVSCISALTFLTSCAPGFVWSKQYVVEVSLFDIEVIDETHMWATGGEGVVFADGEICKEVLKGPGFGPITASDENHVWMAREGEIYFFNGSDLSKQMSDRSSVDALCALDSNHVWASTRDKDKDGDSIYFFDGSTWIKQWDSEDQIFTISTADQSNVWALGDDKIYHFDGSAWSEQFRVGEESGLADLAAADKYNVWALGGSEIFFYDGYDWKKQYDIGEKVQKSGFSMICAADADHVWAFVNGEGFLAHDFFLEEHDYFICYFYNGSSWARQSWGNNDIHDVCAQDDGHVWTVSSSFGAEPTVTGVEGVIFLGQPGR